MKKKHPYENETHKQATFLLVATILEGEGGCTAESRILKNSLGKTGEFVAAFNWNNLCACHPLGSITTASTMSCKKLSGARQSL